MAEILWFPIPGYRSRVPGGCLEEVADEVGESGVRHRGDLEEREIAPLRRAADRLDASGIAQGVGFRGDERSRARGDLRREGLELPLEHGDVLLGVSRRRGVHEVTEQPAPFDVLEKPDAEPGASV